MENYDQYFSANKELWNQRTAVHKDSSFYDVAGFRAGKNTLTPIELEEVGDVKGKSLLHLQCHFGLDTMSWSRLGAKCTGVDLSDDAINIAREINKETKLDAKFVCCNVYDLHPENKESSQVSPPIGGGDLEGAAAFDIVFTSYGTIGWLPDLNKWAEIISYYLKPGGMFYMADFHPVIWMFDDEFTHIKYYYDNRETIITENYGTYTNRKAPITGKEYGWNHGISEILNALINQGLEIQQFNEFMYSPYPNFSNTIQGDEGHWYIKGMEGKIPMVYSIKAIKK
ncbi:MAG: class I SAM-dependent methyltransferase [Bacteroidota bacterium]|nr:class I SAM-dependent methyltransferase [Bacteroidota bacterium]